MAQVEKGFGDGFSATGCTDDTAVYPVLGGRYVVMVNGSFNSKTAALVIKSPDGTNFVAVKNDGGTAVSFTADGYFTCDLPAGLVKVTIGASATSLAIGVLPSPRREV